MGTSFEDTYVENIQDDIRLACEMLQELGYDSMVIMVSQDKHIEMGSDRGKEFIEDNFDCIERFVDYCQESQKPSSPLPSALHDRLNTDMELDDDEFEESPKQYHARKGNIIPKSNIIIIKKLDDMTDRENISRRKTSPSTTVSKCTKNSVVSAAKISPPRPSVVKSVSKQQISVGQARKRTFDCDECEKKYLAKKDLIIHKRKHSGDAPYVCNICSKAFRSSGFLRAHSAVHTPVERYACDICGQMFVRRGGVHRHKIAVHSEKIPYVCEICGRGFNDYSSFRMHKLRHAGVKPHSCEVCGKSFLEPRVLRAHLRIHTGEKPFTCELCGLHFRTNRTLHTHQRRKHEN